MVISGSCQMQRNFVPNVRIAVDIQSRQHRRRTPMQLPPAPRRQRFIDHLLNDAVLKAQPLLGLAQQQLAGKFV